MDLGRIARSRTLWKVLAVLLLLEGGAASGWLVFLVGALNSSEHGSLALRGPENLGVPTTSRFGSREIRRWPSV